MNRYFSRLLPRAATGWLVWAACFIGYSAAGQDASALPYDMDQPVQVIQLENEALREISGLGPTDKPGEYCAISDEQGIIYFIDADHGGTITREIFFRQKGDFEGIEMVGQTIYALKSDGKLFEITKWENPANTQVQEYDTPLKKKDNLEGLCYDPDRKALLFVCKGNPDSSYLRRVLAFDLQSKTLNMTPVYTVDPFEVNRLLPYTPQDKAHFFSPSGIAIHPITHDIYIISTALKRMVVLDYATGNIKFAVYLDKKVMPQPEGIAFDADGTMHLCSEGKKGLGLILKFAYKR
jgi:uncharacterized protein YjiK